MNAENKPSSEAEIEKSFIEVRKAYRLLFSYQKRVIHLMKYIEKHLRNSLDYSFREGFPLYHGIENIDKRKVLDYVARWEWLKLYYFQFWFMGRANIGYGKSVPKAENKEILFGVALQSDSGASDKHKKNTLGRWDPNAMEVENFCPAEGAKTRLIFVVGSYDDWCVKDDYWGINGTLRLLDNNNWKDPKEHEEPEYELNKINDKPARIIGKAYNLASFSNEEKTIAKLDDFKKHCEGKDFMLVKGTW